MRRDWLTAACGGLSLFILLLAAGCGGGGGGGGGGLSPLVYSGNTNQAAVTVTNASRLTANVFGSSNTAGIIAGTSIESGDSMPSGSAGMVNLTRTLNRASRIALAPAIRGRGHGAVPGVFINDIVPCDGGNGSVRTTGTLSDTDGTGTLTITFNRCLIGTDTLNGQATAQVLAVDFVLEIPTDLIISASRLTLRGPGISTDAGGSVRVQISGGTETTTSNLINLDNLTGVMTMGQDLMLVNQFGALTITGTIFDNVYGYVDVSTPMPLAFPTPGQFFPSSGQMVLAGDGTGVVVTTIDSRMVNLQLDSNGDGTPEGFIAFMKWTDLSGPIGADIADTEPDGMHDSWETVNNIADPLVDTDNDMFNNIDEYQAGSNPNNMASTPPNP